MMEPKVSRFYFKNDAEITLIAGMMKRTRAQSIISTYDKGTFLIRFSKKDAASLVLVVSNGVGTTPSEYKVRKGMQTAETLYEVLNEIHCVDHLWYKKGREESFVETDKRKILKHFKHHKDVWKFH